MTAVYARQPRLFNLNTGISMGPNYLKLPATLILVLAVTVLTFIPSIDNDFTNWDDPTFITENRDIQKLSPESAAKFFTLSYGGFAGYVPFVMLTYTLEYRLFGLNSGVFHTTNLLLHLINCVLVFWFIYLISAKLPVAFIVSLLFGVHPFHVEAVAWIQGRKDLLFSFFYLAALIAYVLYLQKGRKKSLYFLSLVFFVFSLFSKVAAISLPFALLVLDYFILKKIDKETIRRKLPFFILAFLFVLFAFLTIEMGSFTVHSEKISYMDNILLFFYSFAFYIHKIILPIRFSARYPIELSQLAPPFYAVLSIAIFAGVIFLLYRLYRSRKSDVTFGVLFFLVTLMPTIPFHFIRQPFADRYMYLPVIGIFYLGALYFHTLYTGTFANSKKGKVVLITVLIVVTASFSAVSRDRCRVWKDSLVLWNDALESFPALPVAYLARGEFLLEKGLLDEAMKDLNRSVELNPASSPAYVNRGIIFFKKGAYRQAMEEYNKVLLLNPDYFKAYLNRANLWGRLGRYREAIVDYTRALELNPDFLVAYFYRAITYRKLGLFGPAVNDLTRMLELDPGDAGVLALRGKSYKDMGKIEPAIKDYEESLRLRQDPDVQSELLKLKGN